jgi:pimeloyl-ACP methyl ester carboxylesterase
MTERRRRVDGLAVVDHHLPPANDGEAGLGLAPRPPGPTVVLVHGSLDRGSSFARVVRRLGDLHVVTYDRRGYERSRSARPRAGGVADHADDLLEIVDGGPAVVVGHSYGGDVALAAAVRDPKTVRAVVAYEPPLPWMAWWPTRGVPAADPAVFAETFFKRMVGGDTWDRLPESTRAARRADGPALAAELNAIRQGGTPFQVEDLVVPAVFGRGERSADRHRRGPEELARQAPGSELVEIAGAAHGAHLTHPDAFAALVRRAVQRALEADSPSPSSS